MKYFLSFTLILMIISCSSTDEIQDQFTAEMPSMPDAVEIDINEDDIIDFVIDFRFVDIEPIPNTNTGNFGIAGSIYPSNNNQVLTKRGAGNLFLREIEDIKESVDEPLIWSTIGFSKQILFIYTNEDGQWPVEWQVSSDSVHSTYFLGLKITDNNLTQLGWLELDINTSNGNVEVINKGIL